MPSVSLRDFLKDPRTLFSRWRRGETVQLTHRGKKLGKVKPPAEDIWGRYPDLVAKGLIRSYPTRPITGLNIHEHTTIEPPEGYDPLQALLAEREAGYRAMDEALRGVHLDRRADQANRPEDEE